MLRRLEVELNGYAFCRQSSNPVLREHKSVFYKKQCGMVWALLAAMEKFAPNGMVRRRARQIDRKYCSLTGEPTPVMRLLSDIVIKLAAREYRRLTLDPSYHRPKQEPFKRYVYDSTGDGKGLVPYRTEWPGKPPWAVRKERTKESLRYFFIEKAIKTRRRVSKNQTDPVIDDYLIGMVSDLAFGFGL